MSFIQRSPISARQLAANRANARKSAGPRTEIGKNNSRFNGLKRGQCAGPFRRVMSELGEDPGEFDRFHQGPRESAEPVNTLEAQLVEDLAVLWWKKRRSERPQLRNLLLEERKEVEEEYRLYRREHAEVSEAAAADACLAPTGERSTWILRQDNYLDRQIQRKIRLLNMLQEKRRKREGSLETDRPPPRLRNRKSNPTKPLKTHGRWVGRKWETSPGAALMAEAREPDKISVLERSACQERTKNQKENVKRQ